MFVPVCICQLDKDYIGKHNCIIFCLEERNGLGVSDEFILRLRIF